MRVRVCVFVHVCARVFVGFWQFRVTIEVYLLLLKPQVFRLRWICVEALVAAKRTSGHGYDLWPMV